MTDTLDEAQEREIRATEMAIRSVTSRLAGDGADECEDCGHPIEPRRRAAMPSATTCIGCQQLRERRGRW